MYNQYQIDKQTSKQTNLISTKFSSENYKKHSKDAAHVRLVLQRDTQMSGVEPLRG